MAAHAFNLQFEGVLGALIGALEGHVLDEVSGPAVGCGLVTGAVIDPNSNGGSFAVVDRFECHAQTGVEGVNFRRGGTEDVVGEGGSVSRGCNRGGQGAPPGGQGLALGLCIQKGQMVRIRIQI